MKNIYNEIRNKISKKYYTPVVFLLMFLSQNSFCAVIKQQVQFAPNNIATWIQNTGTFNQDIRTNNTPGFSWGPRTSFPQPGPQAKFALFTSGLSIGAYINGELRMGNASYNGEYVPGYVFDSTGVPLFKADARFRLYSVKYWDTPSSNPDVVKWKDMVPFGAPYDDKNGNKIYDVGIDKPGMPDASQTVFLCYTDADPLNHTTSEGFSGGTLPIYAEVHLTAWGYSNQLISDVQFFKFDVINKNDTAWEKIYFSLVTDPDLGDATDDYIGCDTNFHLGYCYNATNNDGSGSGITYGANPPAVGQMFLRRPLLKKEQKQFIPESLKYYLKITGFSKTIPTHSIHSPQ